MAGLPRTGSPGHWLHPSLRLQPRWSGQSGPNSGHKPEGSGHKGEEAPATDPEHDPALLTIAEPARQSPRLKPDEMRPIVLRLCDDRYLTFRQLAALLGREPGGLQRWTLRPMAQEGQLLLKYPETPNHPRQAYRTNPSGSGDESSGPTGRKSQ